MVPNGPFWREEVHLGLPPANHNGATPAQAKARSFELASGNPYDLGIYWRMPNPPGANPLVAERAFPHE